MPARPLLFIRMLAAVSMKKIETEIFIHATPQKVWSILADFENHPKWNPFITSISGPAEIGKTISVFLKPPDGNGMAFKPRVLAWDPNREFRWKGKLGIPGIFDGEHYFKLEDLGNGSTKFLHGEHFSGILVGVMGNILENTKKGFVLMNEALKAECEKMA